MKIPAELFNARANNLLILADDLELNDEHGDFELQVHSMREGAKEITDLKAQLIHVDALIEAVENLQIATSFHTDSSDVTELIQAIREKRDGNH